MRRFGTAVVLVVALVATTLSSQPAAAQGGGQVESPPIEYRGSQIHLIGEAAGVPGAAANVTTSIVDFEISDDGTTVWAVAGTQAAGFELLIMSRSGTDLVRKPITANPAPAAVEIALTDPGGAAGIVAVRQSHAVEGVQWVFTSTTSSASTGFFTLYDTSEVGDGTYHDPFNLAGISLATDPHDPTDGFYFVNRTQIFQWNATVPAFAGRVGDNSDLRLNGNALANTVINGGWNGLDVGGGRFITSHDLSDPIGGAEAVITGPSIVYETITDAGQPFVRGTQAEISDDGLTASYCLNGFGVEDVKCYVGPQGGTYDRILPMALNNKIMWAGLAGSGTRIIANEGFGFAPSWTFFANTDGTLRRRAGGLFTYLNGSNDVAIGTPKLSANAAYAIGTFDTTASMLTGVDGLTVVADSGGAFLGMPTISNPRFGYDADGNLLLRAEADGGADSVIVWPMRDGYYDPNADDPLSPPYGSVVLSRIGTSNTFGGTLRVSAGFTQPVPSDLLRFSAVNAAGNRSSYADVRLAPATSNTFPLCNGLVPTVYIALGDLPTPDSDVILGTPGADSIDALDGDDTICAEGGNDTVVGGNGDDTIFGGSGRDILRGGPGVDSIEGEAGNDRLLGGIHGDTINGGDGDDYIGGFGGGDLIDGGAGNDRIFGGFGADIINGGPGADNINGLIGNDVIDGQGGDDTVNGDAGNDTVRGGSGNDVVNGGNAFDSVFGDDGDDTLGGGKADDTLDGGDGVDVCAGNKHFVADTAVNCETIFGVP